MSNVYSSRRIGELLKRDVYSLWLAGMMCPDFRTIIESINWGKTLYCKWLPTDVQRLQSLKVRGVPAVGAMPQIIKQTDRSEPYS